MAIQTYSDLQAAITSWSHRSDLTSNLDNIIYIAEQWIYRNARTRANISTLNLSASGGSATLPTDFIQGKTVYFNSGSQRYRLDPKPADWINDNYNTDTGCLPKFYGIQGGTMIFASAMSGTINGSYYQNLGAVSASAHALFLAVPDLYLFASLAEVGGFVKSTDGSEAKWVQRRDAILSEINRQANESRFGDGMAVSCA